MTPYQVFVSVGTDYHPHDRVATWLDEWLGGIEGPKPTVLFQHGFTRPSAHADNVDFLVYEQLIAAMDAAGAVVVHGGPATIFEARGLGHQPICVPRSPALGEHVDGHQERFARHLAQDGLVTLVESRADFVSSVQEAVTAPGLRRRAVETAPALAAIGELDAIIDELMRRRLPCRALAGERLSRVAAALVGVAVSGAAFKRTQDSRR